MGEDIDVDKIYNHWMVTSDKDAETMIHLFDTNDYHWSLFISHIVLERLLKATVVKKTANHAPFTHDLSKLAKLSHLAQVCPKNGNWLSVSDLCLHVAYV